MSLAENLALITKWLTADVSGNLTGTNTPVQFDNTKALATTEFVKRLGLQFSQVDMLNGNQTLTAAQCGRLCYGTITGGGSYTWTLPLSTDVPAGASIRIKQATVNGVMTVQRSGTDTLYGNTQAITSIVLNGPGTVTLTAINGGWIITDGTAMLPFDGDFAASLASNGWQKFPSGLILQWGLATATTAGSLVTYPIAFPNATFAVITGPASTGVTTAANSPTKTGFTFYASSGSTLHWWAALGN